MAASRSNTAGRPSLRPPSTLTTAMTYHLTHSQLQMYSRPNPQVHTGPVDNDCPLILCDLTLPDTPIIYASEAFTLLTGYTYPEIRGRNCRFLQSPPKAKASFKRSSEDRAALKQIRQAVRDNRECQVQVVNYRKNGTKFLNYLTIIPVRWNSNEFNYSVGLQQGVAELG